MGNLYADAIQWESSFDIMMMGSGSIRKKEFGPIVEYQDLVENTPFDDALWMFKVTGAQFRRMILHIFRDDAWEGHTEFYQFSHGFSVEYDRKSHSLLKVELDGSPLEDDRIYSVGLQDYHYKNLPDSFDLEIAEIEKNRPQREVASSCSQILEETLQRGQHQDAVVEGRLVIHG